MKLIYAIAFAVSFVTAPVASPAQSRDLPLPSAQCTDDYYEDADGQCGAVSTGEILTIEAILAKYGVIVVDGDVIVLYFDDLDDMPVGSIQPRNEDTGSADERFNAEPDEQETVVARAGTPESQSEIAGEAADDLTTTGPSVQSIPVAAEPVDDNRTIE